MSGHELLQMLIHAGVGAWALVFGRKTWSRPEMMHDRWLSGSIARRTWLLRMMAAVWVFIGFIALGSALTYLPPIRLYSGWALVTFISGISLVGTIVILSVTPRFDR